MLHVKSYDYIKDSLTINIVIKFGKFLFSLCTKSWQSDSQDGVMEVVLIVSWVYFPALSLSRLLCALSGL